MWTDVIDLNAFYRTRMGGRARQLIERQVRTLWPSVRGDVVLGLGYATPFLETFRGEAERVLAVMPAYQGVTRWPTARPGLVALSEEAQLPFPDLSIDRLLLVHTLENTERMRDTLRECWRVLNGIGRMIIVVPSRRGLPEGAFAGRFPRDRFPERRAHARKKSAAASTVRSISSSPCAVDGNIASN